MSSQRVLLKELEDGEWKPTPSFDASGMQLCSIHSALNVMCRRGAVERRKERGNSVVEWRITQQGLDELAGKNAAASELPAAKCQCCGAISLAPVHLSPREADVLVQLCKGFSINEIAARLCMSWHTAHGYMREVYRKLGVGSRAEAAIVAVRMGMPV